MSSYYSIGRVMTWKKSWTILKKEKKIMNINQIISHTHLIIILKIKILEITQLKIKMYLIRSDFQERKMTKMLKFSKKATTQPRFYSGLKQSFHLKWLEMAKMPETPCYVMLWYLCRYWIGACCVLVYALVL